MYPLLWAPRKGPIHSAWGLGWGGVGKGEFPHYKPGNKGLENIKVKSFLFCFLVFFCCCFVFITSVTNPRETPGLQTLCIVLMSVSPESSLYRELPPTLYNSEARHPKRRC